MTKIDDARCRDCRYWDNEGGVIHYGHCRKQPPFADAKMSGINAYFPGTSGSDWCGAFEKKILLEAALSPDPEIPVSEEMIRAGCVTYAEWSRGITGINDLVRRVYRAMESARRKEAANGMAVITTSANYTHRHRRWTDGQGSGSICYGHRRKDDPK